MLLFFREVCEVHKVRLCVILIKIHGACQSADQVRTSGILVIIHHKPLSVLDQTLAYEKVLSVVISSS